MKKLFKFQSEIDLEQRVIQLKAEKDVVVEHNERLENKIGEQNHKISVITGLNKDLTDQIKKLQNDSKQFTHVKTFEENFHYLREITNIANNDEFCFFLTVLREDFFNCLTNSKTSIERDVAHGMILALEKLKVKMANHVNKFEEMANEND